MPSMGKEGWTARCRAPVLAVTLDGEELRVPLRHVDVGDGYRKNRRLMQVILEKMRQTGEAASSPGLLRELRLWLQLALGGEGYDRIFSTEERRENDIWHRRVFLAGCAAVSQARCGMIARAARSSALIQRMKNEIRCGKALEQEKQCGVFAPPEGIAVDGVIHPILTDFKAVLEWSRLAKTSGILADDPAESSLLMVLTLCREEPENIADASRELQVFLHGGDPPELEEPGDSQPLLDFEQDFWRIWSGFYRMYGLDLTRVSLHWWQFRSLLEELPADTCVKRVMRIRALQPDMTQEEQCRELLRLKHRYRILEG